MTRTTAFAFMAAVAAILMPDLAVAAEDPAVAGITSLMSQTIAQDWMGKLFGEAGGGQGTTLITEMLRYFNVAVMAIAAIMLTYNLFTGVAETTYHGEFLGKNYSTVWVPVRLPMAAAMMAPTINGLSAIQIIMIKMALLGSAAADWQLGHTIDLVVDKRLPMAISTPRTPTELVSAVFDGATCRHIGNINSQIMGGGNVFQRPTAVVVPGLLSDEIQLRWEALPGSASFQQCGSVSITVPKIDGSDGDDKTTQAKASVRAGLQAALAQVQETVDPLALQFALSSYPGDLKGVIETAAKPDAAVLIAARERLASDLAKVTDTVRNMAIANSTAEAQALKESVKTHGWSRFGVMYSDMFKLSNGYSRALEFELDVEGPHYDTAMPQWIALQAKIEKEKRVFLARLAKDHETKPLKPAVNDFEVATGDRGWASRILSVLPNASSLITAMTAVSNVDEDPIVGLQKLGHAMHSLWYATLAAVTGVAVAAGLVPTMSIAAGLTAPAIMLLGTIGTVLITCGALLSFVVPMLPWAIMFLGAVGWFILVVEAVVAGPLWAFGHLKMDGHGFTGGVGATGYMIVLNIVLRPSLMLIFCVTGLAVLKILVPELTYGFKAAMDTSVSYVGLLNILTAMSMYGGLVFYLYYKGLSLTLIGPDRVLRWIGGGDQDLVGNEGAQKAMAVAGAGSSAMAGMVGQRGGGQMLGTVGKAIGQRVGGHAQIRNGGEQQHGADGSGGATAPQPPAGHFLGARNTHVSAPSAHSLGDDDESEGERR